MQATLSDPAAPLSIWDPVHLGADELGQPVCVTLAERNMLIGGEPGGGKSAALQLPVAHAALSADCRLILIDGKRVELGLWRRCAERFIGPSIDEAIDTLGWLQQLIDERTDWLLDHQKRKITPGLGFPVYLVAVDEIAYFSATAGTAAQQKELTARNRDVVARGRAPGIIAIEATQRPSADVVPTSLRDLFGYRCDDLTGIAAVSLPAESPEPPRVQFDQGRQAYLVLSPNPNLRIIGQWHGPVPEQPGAAALGFIVRVLPSFMHVVRFRDRYILRDGYHRALGLLDRGITHVPVFTRTMETIEQLVPPGVMLLPQDAYLGERAPLLRDYRDDTVARDARLPAVQRMIVIQGNELNPGG